MTNLTPPTLRRAHRMHPGGRKGHMKDLYGQSRTAQAPAGVPDASLVP